MEPKEFSKNVTLSIGDIFFIVGLTFWITKFYLTQNTLEHRIDKKYDRLEKRILKLEEKISSCP